MGSGRQGINFGLAFGSQQSQLSLQKDNWRKIVSDVEAMGFSGIYIPDHFYPQWDPIAAMAAIAAVTKTIDIGSMVCCVDYRHPVVYAKASATINLISNNRHIFGIGAGWMREDYTMAGIPYNKTATRIGRLEEAIKIIKGVWTKESTSLDGKYYRVLDVPKAVDELEYAKPRLMIGGGGKTVLKLAGRYADVVNIVWRIAGGEDKYRKWVVDGRYDKLGEKVDIVRKAAVASGRDPDEIVYGQWIPTRRMNGDPLEEKKKLASRFGATLDEVNDCTWIMADEPKTVIENIKARYDDYCISHYIIDGGDSPSLEDLKILYETIIKPLS